MNLNMFLCEKCISKFNIDYFDILFSPKSKGPCESCNEYALTYDIHHDRLQDKKSEPEQQVQSENEVDKLMKKIGY